MRDYYSTQNDDDNAHFVKDCMCPLLLPSSLANARFEAKSRACDEERLRLTEQRKAEREAEEKAKREAEKKKAARHSLPKRIDIDSDEYFGEAIKLRLPEVPESLPVQIFDLQSIKGGLDLWINSTNNPENVRSHFDGALRNGGARYVPQLTRLQTRASPLHKFSEALLPDVDAKLKSLRAKFPNFGEAIELIDAELRLFSRLADRDFRLSPILLKGSPGVGKSFFASKLAEALSAPFEKLSAGGMQGAFSINGTSPHFRDPLPGQIFLMLSRNVYCSPVILLDEIDKIAGHVGDPIEPVLLDLLEPETAKSFKDECMAIKFDASHCIFIGTANENISAPLASRFHVIDVPPFTHDQQRNVACQIFEDFCDALHVDVEADPDLLVKIAGSDLRSFNRLIRFAVGKALREDRNKIKPGDFLLTANKKHGMGFSL